MMEYTIHVRRALTVAFLIATLSTVSDVARGAECPAKPNLPSANGSQPPNLGVLKLQLMDYKCFGAYDRDVDVVVTEAQSYVEQRARRAAPNEKLALVLDIDETSLSNWPNIAADDFGFIQKGECTLQPKEPCGFDKWINLSTAEAIRPTLNLFNLAKVKDIKVFFISARREDQRIATINNLSSAGYAGWGDLILKQPGDPAPVQQFKKAARAMIEANGFIIIANVGDQDSDLVGGHAERSFKMPNPFYFIP